MKKGTSSEPTGKREAEIEALEALPDEEIDTSDIPEILDWSGARRGLLYRPLEGGLEVSDAVGLWDGSKNRANERKQVLASRRPSPRSTIR